MGAGHGPLRVGPGAPASGTRWAVGFPAFPALPRLRRAAGGGRSPQGCREGCRGRRGTGRGPLDTPRNRQIARNRFIPKWLCVFGPGVQCMCAGAEHLAWQPVGRIHLPPPGEVAVGMRVRRAATLAASATSRGRAGPRSRGRGGTRWCLGQLPPLRGGARALGGCPWRESAGVSAPRLPAFHSRPFAVQVSPGGIDSL